MNVRKLSVALGLFGAYAFALLKPSHWIMQMRQFTNLKRRIEGNTIP